MSSGRDSGHDRHITVFSSEGKLCQVEYAFRAVQAANLTVVGLKGANSVVLVGQRKVSSQALRQDKLLDLSSVSNFYNITEKIGGAFVGIPADCRAMVFRTREKAANFQRNFAYSIPVDYLTMKVANINQMFTQHAYMRLHACTGLLIGIDDEHGPQLYHFDPAGFYTGNKAAVIGVKTQECQSQLDKLLKQQDPSSVTSEAEVIENAIAILQTTLALDFKPADLEVAVCTKGAKVAFRRLTEDEIDVHLNNVAERD